MAETCSFHLSPSLPSEYLDLATLLQLQSVPSELAHIWIVQASTFAAYPSAELPVVLDMSWLHECRKAGRFVGFEGDWAGCRVFRPEISQPELELPSPFAGKVLLVDPMNCSPNSPTLRAELIACGGRLTSSPAEATQIILDASSPTYYEILFNKPSDPQLQQALFRLFATGIRTFDWARQVCSTGNGDLPGISVMDWVTKGLETAAEEAEVEGSFSPEAVVGVDRETRLKSLHRRIDKGEEKRVAGRATPSSSGDLPAAESSSRNINRRLPPPPTQRSSLLSRLETPRHHLLSVSSSNASSSTSSATPSSPAQPLTNWSEEELQAATDAAASAGTVVAGFASFSAQFPLRTLEAYKGRLQRLRRESRRVAPISTTSTSSSSSSSSLPSAEPRRSSAPVRLNTSNPIELPSSGPSRTISLSHETSTCLLGRSSALPPPRRYSVLDQRPYASNSKRIPCPTPGCRKMFKQSNGLTYHLSTGKCEFEPPNRPFTCARDDCDRAYTSPAGLRYHYSISGH